LLEGYDKDVRAIKNEALRISWYMRGGLPYDDAMLVSRLERELINKFINENLEATNKTGLPIF
jgi:hypothetical protein